jgi:hypothetical protein
MRVLDEGVGRASYRPGALASSFDQVGTCGRREGCTQVDAMCVVRRHRQHPHTAVRVERKQRGNVNARQLDDRISDVSCRLFGGLAFLEACQGLDELLPATCRAL